MCDSTSPVMSKSSQIIWAERHFHHFHLLLGCLLNTAAIGSLWPVTAQSRGCSSNLQSEWYSIETYRVSGIYIIQNVVQVNGRIYKYTADVLRNVLNYSGVVFYIHVAELSCGQRPGPLNQTNEQRWLPLLDLIMYSSSVLCQWLIVLEPWAGSLVSVIILIRWWLLCYWPYITCFLNSYFHASCVLT